MSAVLVTTGHLPGPQMVRCGSVRSVATPTSFESLGIIQMRFKRFQLRRWAADDDPHPDNVATKALSHGELGDMLFGLEEPSEEKLPAVEPRDTQELPKWAVDTGMISEYGLAHLRVLG